MKTEKKGRALPGGGAKQRRPDELAFLPADARNSRDPRPHPPAGDDRATTIMALFATGIDLGIAYGMWISWHGPRGKKSFPPAIAKVSNLRDRVWRAIRSQPEGPQSGSTRASG